MNTGSRKISYSAYDLSYPEKAVHLNNFHIDPAHQRQRYGSLVLAALHAHWFRKGFKNVVINNASSVGRSFYVKLGYKKNINGDWIFQL